jgi:hypothetical protein
MSLGQDPANKDHLGGGVQKNCLNQHFIGFFDTIKYEIKPGTYTFIDR